ncbi:MAG: hypothetical protein GY941_22335 [Planctomycetes bacterium]|nr:hypothetical protein [Planctomycetota bacterium]
MKIKKSHTVACNLSNFSKDVNGNTTATPSFSLSPFENVEPFTWKSPRRIQVKQTGSTHDLFMWLIETKAPRYMQEYYRLSQEGRQTETRTKRGKLSKITLTIKATQKNKKDIKAWRIRQHGLALQQFTSEVIDPTKLCSKVFGLEQKAHRLAEDQTNYWSETDEDDWENMCEEITKKLAKVLPKLPLKHLYINADARGYALKLKKSFKGLEKDWGENTILSPEFNGEV